MSISQKDSLIVIYQVSTLNNDFAHSLLGLICPVGGGVGVVVTFFWHSPQNRTKNAEYVCSPKYELEFRTQLLRVRSFQAALKSRSDSRWCSLCISFIQLPCDMLINFSYLIEMRVAVKVFKKKNASR